MAKKKNGPGDKKLKATLRELRADLEQSEAKRARWKKRATRAEATVAELQSRLRQADKKASKALKEAQVAASAATGADATAADARSNGGTPKGTARREPDASWTVVQLRAEARDRGLTGLSGKPKADLLKALT